MTETSRYIKILNNTNIINMLYKPSQKECDREMFEILKTHSHHREKEK